jgi:hypothetical protein
MCLFSGWTFTNIGAYDLAERSIGKALELQVGCSGINDYSSLLTSQHKLEETRQFLDSICGIMPCRGICNWNYLQLNVLMEDWETAGDYHHLWVADSASFSAGHKAVVNLFWAVVLRKTGEHQKADSIAMARIPFQKSRIGKNYGWSFINLARLYAFLNKRDTAIEYLKAYEKKETVFGFADYMMIDPFFENLRDDPEFKAIVTRAQEEQADIRAQIEALTKSGDIELEIF